jgi:hypothetical protein
MSESAPRLVQKGDKITFSQDALKTTDNVVSIEWSQDFATKSMKADYRVVDAVIDGAGVSVTLFVETSLTDSLEKKCTLEESKYTVVVDSDFQYGQDQEQTVRFLVYHNKKNKPYQHRFIETNKLEKMAKIAKKATESVDLAQTQAITSSIERVESTFGDYLHNF